MLSIASKLAFLSLGSGFMLRKESSYSYCSYLVVPLQKEPTLLVQEWRLKEWPEGHFSKVEFTITEKEDSTDIIINQTGVPKSYVPTNVLETNIEPILNAFSQKKGLICTSITCRALEKTKEGWERYYWDAMKRTFGFGSFIL